MKKIFIISQVKNEADIIESFCRYNLTYSDGMLIRDNESSDNTKDIIQNLINEGLSIFWINDVRGKNNFAKKAIDKYNADLIIPLDADEFLYHTDGINPRETLEKLDETKEYQAIWRTYIYEKEPDIELGFMPNNFIYYRNPVMEDPLKYERHKKVIASRHLIKSRSAAFIAGSHFLKYPDEYLASAKIEILEKMVFAHFPIRSKAHVLRKVIPNWIYKWGLPNRAPRDMLGASQLGILFDDLKNHGEISPEKIKQFSIDYAMTLDFDKFDQIKLLNKEELENIKNDLGEALTIAGNMRTSFCSDKLKLRYTDFNEDNKVFLRATLTEIDKVVTNLSKSLDEIQAKYLPSLMSHIYYDTGNGFNHEELLQVPLFRHENYFKAEVTIPQNVKSIRFDPVEGFACIVDNIQINTDAGKIEYTNINGIALDGFNLFDHFDPQIFIDFEGKNISRLQITGNMRHFIIEDISFLSKIKQLIEKYFETKSEINILIADKNNLIAERDGLIADKNNLIAERDTLLNSRSWRLTKPLRKFAAFVRRHKVLRLVAKGLMFIKRKIIKPLSPNEIVKNNYYRWIEQNEPSNEDIKLQRQYSFSYRPKISIVIPVYKASLDFFKELITSIQTQTYENWELCIADTSHKRIKKIKRICAADIRIKYSYLREDNGISANTNEAIKLVSGDYIAFINHNDTLSPFALYENVKCINEQPDVELIYSDEDQIIDNIRCNPVLKPDFAPDSLRSNNYMAHFLVIKQKLLKQLGGFRSEYDGAQNYDLALRVSETTTKIHHIRKVLYHCRIQKKHPQEYSYNVLEACKKALDAHINRLGLIGKTYINNSASGYFHVIYDVIGNPSVSIIIPNKDYMTTLKTCVDSILERSTYNNYEIVIVENNSENEETFTYYCELKKHPKVRVLYYLEKGFNYSKLINFGIKNCSSDYIVQLNNDTEVITPNWLELMLGFAQRPDVGAVGAKLLYPDNSIQHAGVCLFSKESKFLIGHIYHSYSIQNFIAVTGACLMSRRFLYEQNGYMDENFAITHGDIDFCFRLRQNGLNIVYNSLVEIFHFESKTRGYDDTPEKFEHFTQEKKCFINKWLNVIYSGDPYFNTNRP